MRFDRKNLFLDFFYESCCDFVLEYADNDRTIVWIVVKRNEYELLKSLLLRKNYLYYFLSLEKFERLCDMHLEIFRLSAPHVVTAWFNIQLQKPKRNILTYYVNKFYHTWYVLRINEQVQKRRRCFQLTNTTLSNDKKNHSHKKDSIQR